MADRNFKRNNDLTMRHRLGRFFQSGRIRKGLTQEELAEKVGLTKKSISFIENGKTYPSPENIFRITKTPDLSLDEFVFCSIKASLKTRLDASKTLVLIVGENTKNLKSGSCAYCGSYNSYQGRCVRGHYVDFRSYINYECDKAVDADIKIVVLYNSTKVDKSKCPDAVKDKGTHVAMRYKEDGVEYWDYQAVKNAIIN